MKKDNGFTLIELIVVIVMISIMTTVVIININSLKYQDADRGINLIKGYFDETRLNSMEGLNGCRLDITLNPSDNYWYCNIVDTSGNILDSDKIFEKNIYLNLVLKDTVYSSSCYSFTFSDKDGAIDKISILSEEGGDLELAPSDSCFLQETTSNIGINISLVTGRTEISNLAKLNNSLDLTLNNETTAEESDLVDYKDSTWTDSNLEDNTEINTEDKDNNSEESEDVFDTNLREPDKKGSFYITYNKNSGEAPKWEDCNPYFVYHDMSCHVKLVQKLHVEQYSKYTLSIGENDRGLRIILKEYDSSGTVIGIKYLDNGDTYEVSKGVYCVDMYVTSVRSGHTASGAKWYSSNSYWDYNNFVWFYNNKPNWYIALVKSKK